MKKLVWSAFFVYVFSMAVVFASPPATPPRWFVTDGEILSLMEDLSMRARLSVLVKSSNYTMTAAEMQGSRVVLTGDGMVLTIADWDDCNAGDCIIVEIGDEHDKSIDVSSDDNDHFKLNGVDVTASYKIFIDAANEGEELKICKDGDVNNEWKAVGTLDWEDSGGD